MNLSIFKYPTEVYKGRQWVYCNNTELRYYACFVSIYSSVSITFLFCWKSFAVNGSVPSENVLSCRT